MNDDNHDLPIFPTSAPTECADPDVAATMMATVLAPLGALVELDESRGSSPTPCAAFSAAQLRDHVLGWLGFFAAALSDPAALSARPDPECVELGDGSARGWVEEAASAIDAAIRGGVADQLVTMQEARMPGDGVIAMALGEYLVHGWDLARATGRDYVAPADVSAVAHDFLRGTVAPEYRGPDSGFFDHEVDVGADADAFSALLGFVGRNPAWTATG